MRRVNGQVAQAALPPVSILPDWLRRDLRSDHAGETGAVYLYYGILKISKDREIRAFAAEHLSQESDHLAIFDAWLMPADTSLCLPLWRMAGWTLGVLSALCGPKAVFVTVDAVEEFVVAHYAEQIKRLTDEGNWPEVQTMLARFCADEQRHREDARQRCGKPPAVVARLWRAVVGAGSAVAVAVARAL